MARGRFVRTASGRSVHIICSRYVHMAGVRSVLQTNYRSVLLTNYRSVHMTDGRSVHTTASRLVQMSFSPNMKTVASLSTSWRVAGSWTWHVEWLCARYISYSCCSCMLCNNSKYINMSRTYSTTFASSELHTLLFFLPESRVPATFQIEQQRSPLLVMLVCPDIFMHPSVLLPNRLTV
jgi:hypothetical protein